jgi:hypothetical protein
LSEQFADECRITPAHAKRNASKTVAPTLVSGGKLAAHFGVTHASTWISSPSST